MPATRRTSSVPARARLVTLLTVLLAVGAAGCSSDTGSAAGPVRSPSVATATTPGGSPTAAPAPGPVEFRLVQLSSAAGEPPDGETIPPGVRAQFDEYDCAAAAARPTPVGDRLISCDDDGVSYLLGPAIITGGVESAQAAVPANSVSWVVEVKLDASASATFARTSRDLAGTMTQFAIVVDGTVVSAPTVNAPILDGVLQISGSFDEDSAHRLAEQMAAEG
jgi:preprotein translocase subunit SecD